MEQGRDTPKASLRDRDAKEKYSLIVSFDAPAIACFQTGLFVLILQTVSKKL
ncbi:hypothetical protein JJD41_09875 [Oxynema sp. CENA135]|uniref:hypothetical protein n=1 Tax=Oxynema sp. CENA135 TaxID=984206 RepID=UPI00190E4839|nr:hypothetical protein [Oxynema sp. CENA135]MBK4730164.1 hypothetical protein [Oxynema sp. CENA135]